MPLSPSSETPKGPTSHSSRGTGASDRQPIFEALPGYVVGRLKKLENLKSLGGIAIPVKANTIITILSVGKQEEGEDQIEEGQDYVTRPNADALIDIGYDDLIVTAIIDLVARVRWL